MKTKTQTELVPLKVGDWVWCYPNGMFGRGPYLKQVTHVTATLFWVGKSKQRAYGVRRTGLDRLATQKEIDDHLAEEKRQADENSARAAAHEAHTSREEYQIREAIRGRCEHDTDAVEALPIENLREAARLLGVKS